MLQLPMRNIQPINFLPPADTFGSSGVTAPGSTFAPYTTGGTSGNGSGKGANVLSVNLGGGNFNYDIGPNTDYFAQGAYNFLGNSFNADSALLGDTIIGSQRFLASEAAPIAAFNTQVLPTMFGTLAAQNYSLGSQAVQAEAQVATASVAGSQAATAQAQSSGGGFCFITTAVCEVRGEPDDGPTLTTLRAFRDSYMKATPERRKLIEEYYRIGPVLVSHIKARSDARQFLESLFTRYIVPAKSAIRIGDNEKALAIYTQMLRDVETECFLPHGNLSL